MHVIAGWMKQLLHKLSPNCTQLLQNGMNLTLFCVLALFLCFGAGFEPRHVFFFLNKMRDKRNNIKLCQKYTTGAESSIKLA